MKITENGLTNKQVIESRTKYGSNKISVKKQNSFIKIFVESLGEPMTKILIIALAIKTLFLIRNFDWYETVGIAIAIFIASLISTVSEYGSEASFKKLQEEASKINCRVYRNNKLEEIPVDEVVKSDVVLLDDNFESIAKAMLYGRTIFKSIRKFIILQLTINMCAVGISIVGPFIGIKDPITVVQMLWVNMIMDTFAAIAFAGEPALAEYMDELPKKRDEHIINSYMFGQILFTGVYSFLLCLLFLKLPIIRLLFANNISLMTAFFGLFIFIGIFNCFNARTYRLNIIANILKNKGFIMIMTLIILIQIYIIYYGGSIFRVDGLELKEFIFIILLSLTVVPIDWIRKIALKRRNKNTGV